MDYKFKLVQELAWMVFVAVVVSLFTALVSFDAALITDWRVWATGIFSGIVRAVAAVVVSNLTGKFIFEKN